MGCLIDLTNQKFGRFTVLSIVPKEERPNQKYVYWYCQCECGAIKKLKAII